MLNEISDDNKLCYIRSKCYPSMQKGLYVQWILTTKEAPFQVIKAHCTCPAGCGEGCTHVAGLLFALEGRLGKRALDEMEELPCTSKPCQWNKPRKRKKETRPIIDINFKRIKYEDNIKRNEKKSAKYSVDGNTFRNSLCAKLGNTSRAALFDIIPPVSEHNIDVESDLNISNFEEVETSEHIVYESDSYVDLLNTIKTVPESEYSGFLSTCTKENVEEIEVRTKGQHENPLWFTARTGRITATTFHDIKNKKISTKPDNIVNKVLGHNHAFDNKALEWGRKNEPIAKKRYKAYKKLKEKKVVHISEMGLVLSEEDTYLGASPDGLVSCGSEQYLIEVKCPYKWRNSSLSDALKDKDFCCVLDDNQNFQLKRTHRYFTQVQGQMGICKMEKCDFVLYTLQDFIIISVAFDRIFWENMLQKLKDFYRVEIVPKMYC